ncbi:MAG: T9SS type A sorting domain-containing protein [Bacteroidales bacterium]|nr:T9SS type A sorting domain-containing protein [Bacteroidales bacterium]
MIINNYEGSIKEEIDISGLSQGVYFVTLQNGPKQHIMKVVVK